MGGEWRGREGKGGEEKGREGKGGEEREGQMREFLLCPIGRKKRKVGAYGASNPM